MLLYHLGKVTLGNVMTAFPFRNTVQLMVVSGRTLLAMLEHSVEQYDVLSPPGGFLQVSGL